MSPGQQLPTRRTKSGDLSIVFSVQGTRGSPTGPDPENKLGAQETGSPGRPVSSGLQVPGEQEQGNLGDRPATFSFQNVIQLHQQKLLTLLVDRLALRKIIEKGDAVLI
jgi:hypothetical protein